MNRIFQVVDGGSESLHNLHEKIRNDKSADTSIVYLADNYVDMIRSAYTGILFMVFTELPTIGAAWVIQTAENFNDLIKKLDNY